MAAVTNSSEKVTETAMPLPCQCGASSELIPKLNNPAATRITVNATVVLEGDHDLHSQNVAESNQEGQGREDLHDGDGGQKIRGSK